MLAGSFSHVALICRRVLYMNSEYPSQTALMCLEAWTFHVSMSLGSIPAVITRDWSPDTRLRRKRITELSQST